MMETLPEAALKSGGCGPKRRNYTLGAVLGTLVALRKLLVAVSTGGLLLSSASLASAETINLSCAGDTNGNRYVILVWLNLDQNKVQTVQGGDHSAYAPNADADALARERRGETQTYSLTVSDDYYKWTAYNGANVPVTINRMTGVLAGPSFSAACSRAAFDPPPLPMPKF